MGDVPRATLDASVPYEWSIVEYVDSARASVTSFVLCEMPSSVIRSTKEKKMREETYPVAAPAAPSFTSYSNHQPLKAEKTSQKRHTSHVSPAAFPTLPNTSPVPLPNSLSATLSVVGPATASCNVLTAPCASCPRYAAPSCTTPPIVSVALCVAPTALSVPFFVVWAADLRPSGTDAVPAGVCLLRDSVNDSIREASHFP